MKRYNINAGARCLVFEISAKKLHIFTASFNEPSTINESDLLDSPVRRQLGTSLDIEDARFGIVNEFSKYGFYTFQRWKDSDSTDPDKRTVIALWEEDIKVDT